MISLMSFAHKYFVCPKEIPKSIENWCWQESQRNRKSLWLCSVSVWVVSIRISLSFEFIL